MRGAVVTGIGSYVPDQVLTNRDLERIVETSDEWIVSHTGMRERRVAAPDQAASDLGTLAARRALADAGLTPDDLDLIICATITGDMIVPATSCLIQANLGASHCGAFDLASGCTGWIYGLGLASGMIRSGECDHVLVIATEILTRVTNWTDRATCVLFGDAAGAAVVSAGETGTGILAHELVSVGEASDLLIIRAGGSRQPLTHQGLDQRLNTLEMNGPELFKLAVRGVPEVAERTVAKAGLRMSDLKLVVMHQANQRILEAVAKRLSLAEEQVISIIGQYGNTSASSLPLALDLAYRQGRLEPGDDVLLVGFGSGFTLGAAVLRWTKPAPAH